MEPLALGTDAWAQFFSLKWLEERPEYGKPNEGCRGTSADDPFGELGGVVPQ